MWLNIFFIPIDDIPLATWKKKRKFVFNAHTKTQSFGGERGAPLFWFSPSLYSDTPCYPAASRGAAPWALEYPFSNHPLSSLSKPVAGVIQWQGGHPHRGCHIPHVAAIILRMLIPALFHVDSGHTMPSETLDRGHCIASRGGEMNCPSCLKRFWIPLIQINIFSHLSHSTRDIVFRTFLVLSIFDIPIKCHCLYVHVWPRNKSGFGLIHAVLLCDVSSH